MSVVLAIVLVAAAAIFVIRSAVWLTGFVIGIGYGIAAESIRQTRDRRRLDRRR